MTSAPLLEPVEKLFFSESEKSPSNGRSKGFDKSHYLTELQRLINGKSIIDMLFHFPRAYINRRFISSIQESEPDEVVSLFIRVLGFQPPMKPSAPLKVVVSDVNHRIFNLTFFGPESKSMRYRLKKDHVYGVCGKAQFSYGLYEMVNPEHIFHKQEKNHYKGNAPIYPATALIKQGTLFNMMRRAVDRLCDVTMKEWIPSDIIEKNTWPNFFIALKRIHNPLEKDSPDMIEKAKERLAFDEILSRQLLFKQAQALLQKAKAPIFEKNEYLEKLKTILPFELTQGQTRAISDITKDVKKGVQMTRLIQGDVGCGKTLVAFSSMLQAFENGFQSAYLAPTEILAQQHYQPLQKLAIHLRVNVEILTGRTRGKKREELLNDLKDGKIHILIGTHALLEDSVVFKNLGLCLIDEQHRFGVDQRHKLLTKAPEGLSSHLLSMTATPIPRTLLMTSYGDLDVSLIPDKPKGRLAIKTQVVSLDKMEELINKISSVVQKDRRVYWVCPLIEDSESEYAAAQERFKHLQTIFKDQVVLTHGRMKPQEKDEAMRLFKEGEAKIMVATTVIEVGVDVPQANIMVVENAEHFGLAQLHQLRGRVGRGTQESYCLLLYNPKGLTNIAKERLKAMKATDDGFKIADLDLRLRGGGDILGRQQSGFTSYKLIDIAQNPDLFDTLLTQAQEVASQLVKKDPTLQGQAVQDLLQVFKKEESMTLMKAG